MKPTVFAAILLTACGGPALGQSEADSARDPAGGDAAAAAAPEAGENPPGEDGGEEDDGGTSGQSAHGSSGLAPAEAGSRAGEGDASGGGPAADASPDAGADDDGDAAIVYSGGAVVWTDAGPMASEQPGGIISQCPVLGETWCSANGDLLWTCEGHVDYATGAIVNTAPFYWNGGGGAICTPTPPNE